MVRCRPTSGARFGRFLATCVAAALLAGTAATPPVHAGQEAEAIDQATVGVTSRPLSLGAAVSVALDHNPLTRAARLDVQRRQLDVEQYEDFWNLPSFNFNGYSGIVPAARGNVLYSPDTASDLNDLGPFYRFEVGLVLPLYTFGRLRHAAGAARGAVNAEQARADRIRDELTQQVVTLYWGLVAADELLGVADEMRSSYDDLLEKIEDKLEAAAIDPNDAYEAQTAKFDIERAYLDAGETYTVVQRALAELLGDDRRTLYVPSHTAGPEVAVTRDDLPQLEQIAVRTHPQLRALRAAVGALEEAMALEQSNRWPIVLAGGGFSMAQSPNRDDQVSPFAYDEFNFRRLAAALNVRWDLNFARHRLDFLKRQLERDATEARAHALGLRVSIDVHRALEKVLKFVELVESARETRRISRRWLRTAFDDFDLGIGEAQPLIKAYRADYRLQGLIIETQYELNTALAELALVLGDFHTYVRWVADGRVSLD